MDITEQQIIESWKKQYNESNNGNNSIEQVIKNCHKSHFDIINMNNIIGKYIGNIDDFIVFLENEWKWKIEFKKEIGIILADENKEYCVCPLYNSRTITTKNLCFCSEGFAEEMFSKVLQKNVNVKIIRSYIRDNKSCIYEITISR